MENQRFACSITESIRNLDPVFCKVMTGDGETLFVKKINYSYGNDNNYVFRTEDIISEREYRLRKLQSKLQDIKDWDGWDYIKFALMVILIFCAILSPFIITDYFMRKSACELYAQLNGWDSIFNYFSGGCYVNHPDLGWINSINNINIK